MAPKPRWHPQCRDRPGPFGQRSGGGAGQGDRASWSRIRGCSHRILGLSLPLPAPPSPGQSVPGQEPHPGSRCRTRCVTPPGKQASLLQALGRGFADGRGGQRLGWAARGLWATAKGSLRGREEAEAQREQQPAWSGPGPPRGGGCRVAEAHVAALPGDPPKEPGLRHPLVGHVGVGAPGGAALAEQNLHSVFCARKRKAGGWLPGGRTLAGRGAVPTPGGVTLGLPQAVPCGARGTWLPTAITLVTAKRGLGTTGPAGPLP